MRNIVFPEKLRQEFATVEAVLNSNGETRRVDALLLSWVKYEKQLRRLFSFFVYQHPGVTPSTLDAVISAFAANRNLNPETFISGIKGLGVIPVSKMLGSAYAPLWAEITRIKKYRNKIMHGQHTGQGIKSAQLEKDIVHVMNWVHALAEAADSAFGYDGLRRNTYVAAKSSAKIVVAKYPFSTPAELRAWLGSLRA